MGRRETGGTVFGFTFGEVVLIGVVTLVAIGPDRLLGMLRDFGTWIKGWFDGG